MVRLFALLTALLLAAPPAAVAEMAAPPVQIVAAVPPLTVAIGKNRSLTVSARAVLESEADRAAFTAALPAVTRAFQSYMDALKIEDLRGSAGYSRLRTELLSRARAVAPEARTTDLVFDEILVK
jgi:hypothetical protein